jgi:hypothetical protein
LAPIEYKATIKRSEPENLFSSKKPEATKPAEPKKKLIRGKALKSSGAKRLQAKKKDDRLRSQGDEDGANLFGNDHLLADRLPKSVEPLRFKKVRMGMLAYFLLSRKTRTITKEPSDAHLQWLEEGR